MHAVANFMYAFGDSKEPLQETADVVEELMLEYIQALLHESSPPVRARWKADDILATLKRDPPKHSRAMELLSKKDMQFFADSKGVIESSIGERLAAPQSAHTPTQQKRKRGRFSDYASKRAS